MPEVKSDNLPNPWYSAIPLAAVFCLFNFFKLDIIASLAVGAILSGLMFLPYYGGAKQVRGISGKAGGEASTLTLIVCSLSAYGALIAAMTTFSTITDGLIGIPGPPLIKAAFFLMLVTGVSGSGPAGIGAGVPMFTETFQQMGVNMSALHRIAAFSGVSLDSLPSNAGINVVSRLSGYTVMKTYKYSFMTTVFTTCIGTVLVAVFLTLFPGMA